MKYHIEGDSVGTKDHKKWVDIEVDRPAISTGDLLIGLGFIGLGLFKLVRSAFISGARGYHKAYDEALVKVGAFSKDDFDEVYKDFH